MVERWAGPKQLSVHNSRAATVSRHGWWTHFSLILAVTVFAQIFRSRSLYIYSICIYIFSIFCLISLSLLFAVLLFIPTTSQGWQIACQRLHREKIARSYLFEQAMSIEARDVSRRSESHLFHCTLVFHPPVERTNRKTEKQFTENNNWHAAHNLRPAKMNP